MTKAIDAWPCYAAEIGPFGHDLSLLCFRLALALVADGASEADAASAVVNVLITRAAGQACRNATQLLGREPDPEKWRRATDKAFVLAAKRTAKPLKSEAAP